MSCYSIPLSLNSSHLSLPTIQLSQTPYYAMGFIFIGYTLLFICQVTAQVALPPGHLPDAMIRFDHLLTCSQGTSHISPDFSCTYMTICLMTPFPAKLKIPGH